MDKTLEQETQEEFEEKYNLIFENPVSSNEDKAKTTNQILNSTGENEDIDDEKTSDDESLSDAEPTEECTALVTLKERRLMAAQNMFKKSIRISLKSFLISLSLSFLNLFI